MPGFCEAEPEEMFAWSSQCVSQGRAGTDPSKTHPGGRSRLALLHRHQAAIEIGRCALPCVLSNVTCV